MKAPLMFGAVLAIAMAGCDQKPVAPAPTPTPTPKAAASKPKSASTHSASTSTRPLTPVPLTPVPLTPVPLTPVPLTPVPQATASAPVQPDAMADPAETPNVQDIARLERDYLQDKEGDRKMEVIFELSDMDAPLAWQALSRLLTVEKDPETKSHLILALGDTTMPEDQKIALMSQYVGAEQPEQVREMAIEALDDIDDPRAIVTWQRLLQDQDENIRDTAEAAIERLKQPAE